MLYVCAVGEHESPYDTPTRSHALRVSHINLMHNKNDYYYNNSWNPRISNTSFILLSCIFIAPLSFKAAFISSNDPRYFGLMLW